MTFVKHVDAPMSCRKHVTLPARPKRQTMLTLQTGQESDIKTTCFFFLAVSLVKLSVWNQTEYGKGGSGQTVRRSVDL